MLERSDSSNQARSTLFLYLMERSDSLNEAQRTKHEARCFFCFN